MAYSKTSRRSTVWKSSAGWVATVALVLLSGVGVVAGLGKLLGIAWTAFAAMAGGAFLGSRAVGGHARELVWSYGLASGAMITSCAVFLVPPAIGHAPSAGGFGIALGLIVGFVLHAAGHQLTHRNVPLEPAVVELTAHALAAGSIIGLIYAAMPGLGLLLGLVIVSHKGPAGYAAARRLRRKGKTVGVMLLPAAAVGLTALPAGLLSLPEVPVLNALVSGFAAGIFLHAAMDFLPRCELGGEIYEVADVSDDAHHRLDRLRTEAAFSTVMGGLGVAAAWVVFYF